MSEDAPRLAPDVEAAFRAVEGLSAKGFRSWLSGFPAHRRVGEIEEPRSCPLARYLETLAPGSWCVFGDEVEYEGEGKEHSFGIDLPDWAERFVRQVDDLRNASPQAWRRRVVRAGEALVALDEAGPGYPPEKEDEA